MLDKLTAEDFGPYVGHPFTVGEVDHSVPLELVDVTASRIGASGARPSFSLVFRGTPVSALPQGVHRVVHPMFGVLGVFLVPLGSDGQGMRYEAIFN